MTCEDLIEAYYACRKNKRNSINALKYEAQFESKIISLLNRVNNRTYEPSRSIAFVVTQPRLREVFAANFEDRIIHHYIAIRIEPLLESVFNDRTYNCRVGKGTKAGVDQLTADIRSCSEEYTKDCYVAKIDLKGFFMSIDRELLWSYFEEFIADSYDGDDKDELLWIAKKVVMNRPELNCIKKSPQALWDRLPKEKSLFTNPDKLGLPIGNLTSQLLANLLLNPLDWYIEGIGIELHGRYVDDLYLVHRDKYVLLDAISKIRVFARDQLHVHMNERKTIIQHFSKGVSFTGAIIKPGRRYMMRRSSYGLRRAVLHLNKQRTIEGIRSSVCSINSYLGLASAYDSYHIRRSACELIDKEMFEFMYIGSRFKKLILKKRYTEIEMTNSKHRYE